jgi:hypothetical protein
VEKISAVVRFGAAGELHAARIVDALPGNWRWTISADGEVVAATAVIVDADCSDEERYAEAAEAAEAEIMAAIAATIGEAAEFRFAA